MNIVENFINKKDIESLINHEKLILLNKYTELLIEYNSRFNLTSILNHEDIYIKHYLDSLSGLVLLKKKFGDDILKFKIADIGTGPGFPGMILKLFSPDLNLTLIESNSKKSNFLNVISSSLNIKPAIINKNVKEVKGKFDILISRGFSDIFSFIKKTKHLYNDKTYLYFYKGKKNKILDEFNVVKNIKIGLNIRKANLYQITGFIFERNILELLWEKS